MRVIKVLVVLGALAALAVPAGAIQIFNQPYQGPIVIHITNWEDSVTYSYNAWNPATPGVGYLADNVTPIVVGQPYAANLVQKYSSGINLMPGESQWGIMQVDQILSAGITGPNSISTGAITLYDKGSSPIDIVGIFYGSVDQTVQFGSPDDTQQRIITGGMRYEIFAQPKGSYDSLGNPALGAGARLDNNEFPGVGYDGTGANKLMPGAERIVTGQGQPGMTMNEFYTNFDLTQLTSTFDTYLSVMPSAEEAFDSAGNSVGFEGTMNGPPTPANYGFNTDIFPCGGFVPFVPGTTADFRMKGTAEPTSFNWLVRSSDPITTAYQVPEPVTMLGLMLGVGGLGGYLRRRSRLS